MFQTSKLVSLDIHLVKEPLYIRLKNETETRAYKLNGCVGSTVLPPVTVVLLGLDQLCLKLPVLCYASNSWKSMLYYAHNM